MPCDACRGVHCTHARPPHLFLHGPLQPQLVPALEKDWRPRLEKRSTGLQEWPEAPAGCRRRQRTRPRSPETARLCDTLTRLSFQGRRGGAVQRIDACVRGRSRCPVARFGIGTRPSALGQAPLETSVRFQPPFCRLQGSQPNAMAWFPQGEQNCCFLSLLYTRAACACGEPAR